MSTTVDYNSTTVDYKGRMRRRVLSVGSIPIDGLSTQSQTGSTPASQVRPPATWRAAASAGGCLRPDVSTRTDSTMATRISAGTSPHRCPMWWSLPKDWTAMIAAWTTLEHTVNQIRLIL